MGITSLQVCMDSDWLQGAMSEEGMGMDSSSPITTPTGEEMLTCSRPLIERRLRPQHEQSLKCPRCESTHTKFCYYNNYSLSQPRYFCKTCRRYWTKGGTLRNIPVGGGCRKNTKKLSSKKQQSDQSPSSSSPMPNAINTPLSYNNNNNHANATDLHLAFPDQIHYSHLHASGLYGATPYGMLESPTPIDFMENKYEALLATHDGFIGNGDSYGGAMMTPPTNAAAFHGGGYGFDPRLMLPYENDHHQNLNHHQQHHHEVEVKPNAKVLTLEWHDHQQACNSDGYNFGGLGSWAGLMNGYGSSATNPLV
ncbi:hypothetical protein ACS0TY_034797 [Phlomoides rotata]